MTNPKRYQKRREDILRRIATSSPGDKRCRILECDQPVMSATGKGLNGRFCRRHVDQYRRHGSYYKKSYSPAELRPYRQRALRWLRGHQNDSLVVEAEEAIERLYWRAGPEQQAFRLAGQSPATRSRYYWARLRARAVNPLEVLAVWLAIERRIGDDPQPDRRREFKVVQAAKLIHRMAGGTHKRWDHELDGRRYSTEMHKHPASRGLVLRHVGADLEKASKGLTSRYLSAARNSL